MKSGIDLITDSLAWIRDRLSGWVQERWSRRLDAQWYLLCLGLLIGLVIPGVLDSEMRLWNWSRETWPVVPGPDNPFFAAFIWWGIVSFGLISIWVEGIRALGIFLPAPREHRPLANRMRGKNHSVNIFHGLIERALITAVAIPFMRHPPGIVLPDTTAMSGLLIGATLYMNMRWASRDFKEGQSIYALWNLGASVCLGIVGAWIWWTIDLRSIPS
jgi:hypothetical protein